MAMVGVVSGSLYRGTHSLSRGLGLGSAVAWRHSTFIKWTGWSLAMALPWWQHYKHCCGYYYYFYCIVYCYNGAQRYEQFLQVSGPYQALILLDLALCLSSASVSSWCYIYNNNFICLHPSLYLVVGWAWWDWSLMWLTNHCLSVLWHCWFGHLTHKIVFEMTNNVSSGTLNSTVRYCGVCQWHIILEEVVVFEGLHIFHWCKELFHRAYLPWQTLQYAFTTWQQMKDCVLLACVVHAVGR